MLKRQTVAAMVMSSSSWNIEGFYVLGILFSVLVVIRILQDFTLNQFRSQYLLSCHCRIFRSTNFAHYLLSSDCMIFRSTSFAFNICCRGNIPGFSFLPVSFSMFVVIGILQGFPISSVALSIYYHRNIAGFSI